MDTNIITALAKHKELTQLGVWLTPLKPMMINDHMITFDSSTKTIQIFVPKGSTFRLAVTITPDSCEYLCPCDAIELLDHVIIKLSLNSRIKEISRLANILVDPEGKMLPYTTQAFAEQVKEVCSKQLGEWDKLFKQGYRIANCRIEIIDFVEGEV